MQGRYIDADQFFEQTEPALLALAPAERARYSLYRGATYLALGDQLMAQRWLGYGAKLASAPPGQLSGSEQQLLRSSLSAVESHGAALNAVTGTAATGAGLTSRALRLEP